MRGYRLSADDLLRRAVIGRLLCHTVIPKHEIEREFSITFDEYFAPELQRLEEARDEGLVALDSAEIRVTPLGRIFIRNVAMAFDRYLREQQMDHSSRFSRRRSERAAPMNSPTQVAVIGAGISGLACAYRLQQLGR